MMNPNLIIRIPTGIFSYRKETMSTALELTIGKLKDMTSKDIVTANCVEEILNKTRLFFNYDNLIPEKIKRQI